MSVRYVSTFAVPKSVPKGCVLMHNHVRHSIDMPCGVNGFRAWTDTKTPNRQFKRCPCGWSGLPHYSRSPNYKCEPLKKLCPNLSSRRDDGARARP